MPQIINLSSWPKPSRLQRRQSSQHPPGRAFTVKPESAFSR